MAHKQVFANFRNLFLKSSRNASSKYRLQNVKDIGVGGYMLLTIPVTTFCLGTWQVKRRTWKLNLIEEVKKMNREPPVAFPDDPNELSEMEYKRVKVSGTFDHSKELFIGPRQLITNEEEKAGGIFSGRPISGYLVVTPFHLSDKNLTILVNRGWVPKHKKDASTRIEGQVENEIELIATVRNPEKRPQFSPKTNPGSNLFFYRDVSLMARMTGAAPILIDADASSSVPGGPIGGQTRVTFRNEHLSYILTWYSLCIATSYIWYKKYLRISK